MEGTEGEQRTCKVCAQSRPLLRFPRTGRPDKTGRHHHLRTCWDCRNAEQKARLGENLRERMLHAARVMNSAPRLRGHPKVDPHACADRVMDAVACAYCGQPNDGTAPFGLDHEVPLKLGGAHSLENLVACCERCNRAKHDSPPDEYRAWLADLVARGQDKTPLG